MLTKLGGRKYLFAIFIVVLGFILVLLGDLGSAEWLSLAEIVGGTYVLGNVATKFASGNSRKK